MSGVGPDGQPAFAEPPESTESPESTGLPQVPKTQVIPVIAVVGPTATGKSALAIALAERLGGEIINADAMQLYRGMDIGTAKVPVSERGGIPHHQLDVLGVTEEASVAAYQQGACADRDAIIARGAVPILVGGSGLYVRAALDRLEIPPTDPNVRAALEVELAADGPEPLVARLAQADPAAASTIDPRNVRRVIRALEVIALTGRPFSATLPTRELAHPAIILGLTADLVVLDAHIERRTRQMWADGLLTEVTALLEEGLAAGKTASTAIGYQQAIAQLAGELTEDAAIDATSLATRRLVRRQRSWFGPDPRITWLPADSPDLVDRAIAVIADAGGLGAPSTRA